MSIKTNSTSMIDYNISKICFLIFFLLKPFYILPSGSLQLGDIFLGLSFCFCLKNHNFLVCKKDKMLWLFILCVFIINGIYFLIYQNTGFILSTLYFIFIFMAIYCFRLFMKDRVFLNRLKKICQINILIQLLIFLLGLGKYWSGTYRYIGTYNDPNQLGFAVISTFFILYLLESEFLFVYFSISIFLIFQTYSSGMLLAICALMFFHSIMILKKVGEGVLSAKTFVILFLVIVLGVIVFLFIEKSNFSINWDRFRFEDKLYKGNDPVDSFLRDRNLLVIRYHPEFFIFGYGEGYANRYSYQTGELHSTIISICYYYGIIPFIFFVKWIIKNIKGISVTAIPVFLALIFEAFTLVNHRQPAFWMIIMMCTIYKGDDNIEPKIQHNSSDI